MLLLRKLKQSQFLPGHQQLSRAHQKLRHRLDPKVTNRRLLRSQLQAQLTFRSQLQLWIRYMAFSLSRMAPVRQEVHLNSEIGTDQNNESLSDEYICE